MGTYRRIHAKLDGEKIIFTGTLEELWANYPGAKLVKVEYLQSRMEETRRWRDIPGYIGLYQMSNKKDVKSLARIVKRRDGTTRSISERIMTVTPDGRVVLTNRRKIKQSWSIHKLYNKTFS